MINKLAIHNLSFGYQDKSILKDFFMAVGDGQMVSVVGPNGSGKSTLIKCIDRILTPASGKVSVDRCDVVKMNRREIARRIAYVPQNALRVFPNTVFDVVLMGRRPHLSWKGSAKEEDKAWEMLQLLGIENLALAPFSDLSGGQQQKVLIARALAQETGVILLDEPTSNLDIWHQIDVMEILRRLVRRRRLTAVIAIHDLNMAARYSDKIMMMKKGQIVASGKPDDVMTGENLEVVYGIKANVRIAEDCPFVIPLGRVVQKAN
ncbi:ABC transporter ATP-binding protein [Desulfosarcina ovata subsp. sediminis]|uniref:ABC transporter ATP-binding protein n=1 Tax=Desulfosarcina ovata subsp. sediminis TaxID=885957 RepID=A0A5K8A1R1_9BACT|nr:ABC transporter ATP-binding protein [Desulfosarcina ovata]BBO86483.1 ABC transporter ATP-binding protein [Desulfosarcina ovata subsp. sediminis]